MGFEMLPITEEDVNELDPHIDIFEITSPERWVPARFRANNVTQQDKQVRKKAAFPEENPPVVPQCAPLFSEFEPFEPSKHPFDVEQLELAESTSEFTSVDEVLARMSYEQITKQDEFHPEDFGYPALDLEQHETKIQLILTIM